MCSNFLGMENKVTWLKKKLQIKNKKILKVAVPLNITTFVTHFSIFLLSLFFPSSSYYYVSRNSKRSIRKRFVAQKIYVY